MTVSGVIFQCHLFWLIPESEIKRKSGNLCILGNPIRIHNCINIPILPGTFAKVSGPSLSVWDCHGANAEERAFLTGEKKNNKHIQI